MNLIRRTVFAVLLPGLLGPAVIASDSVPKTPALVVVVSVDQLAYDYLQRFRHNFTDDGLTAQALKQGIWFSNCKHQHAFTHTGPGHAVLMTGALPLAFAWSRVVALTYNRAQSSSTSSPSRVARVDGATAA